MKFTISWLKEHLDTNASIDEISETLTKIGLEVEEVYNPAAALEGFVTAKIIKKDKHPDADKLSLLTVDTGSEHLQVVCGAPNCREGLVGIFAKAGTLIPEYNEVLKVGKIRGVESFGMMCSEKELCLGNDHSGIIELPNDTKAGVEACEVMDIDPVIEIAITPNRSDCLGVRGIARDLAAAGLGKLKELEIKQIPESFTSSVKIKVEDSEACPVYVGRYIRGVNNKAQTPKWMKDRLSAIGLKPISPLVDITNYINYDLCRPLHVFDADKLNGDVVVRMSKMGEKFTSLEDKVYELDDKCVSICDSEGIQCLGGIMGGLEKSCSEETTDVFLECAMFTPEAIARTGRKFNIESDSRYRYERWVAPDSNRLGSDYATQLIVDICGGEASNVIVDGKDSWEGETVCLSPNKVKDFVGIDVSQAEAMEILSKLGFEVSEKDDVVSAIVPAWRGDVSCESDLVEEVVRMVGLDKIPALSMPSELLPKQTLTPAQRRQVTVKHELASRGMYETVTWSFTSSEIGKYFRTSDEILISNPIAADLNEMRQSILPNLLLGAKNNIARGYSDVSIFEVGPEFMGRNPGEQRNVAAGIRTGRTSKRSWIGDVRSFDLFDVKADALAAIAAANGPFETAQITSDAPSYYHPGRSGSLRLGKNVLAYFGEVHPAVLKAVGVKQRVMAFEVYVDNVPMPKGVPSKAKRKLELSSFQPVEKDLAFTVARNVDASSIISAAKTADRENISEVRIFDVYEGENISADKKSIAISVIFQAMAKTYTDEDLDALMRKVILSVEQKTGAELRK